MYGVVKNMPSCQFYIYKKKNKTKVDYALDYERFERKIHVDNAMVMMTKKYC